MDRDRDQLPFDSEENGEESLYSDLPKTPEDAEETQQEDLLDTFSTSQFILGDFSGHNGDDGQAEQSEKEEDDSLSAKKAGKDVSKRKKTLKAIGRVVLSLFLVFVITGCLVVGAFAIYVFGFVDDTVQEDLDDLKLAFTTTIYVQDKASGEYVEYQRLHGGENRIWVSSDKIPEQLKNAYIAIEDKRFRTHNGVDWKRTFSAFFNMFIPIYSSNQGGSTITQQLVKNLTDDKDQNAMRKVREIMRARYLERNYSKDTILECYLNTIALANGIGGVEVAANFYFDKTVSDLTLVECAALAAMAKEPERYRPDTQEGFENNKQRRSIVLGEMLEQGMISQAEYDEAIAAEITVVASRENLNEVEVNSYFVDTVIDQVVEALVTELNYDEAHANKNFYNGGYKIYCTLDPDVQQTMEAVYNDEQTYFKQTLTRTINGEKVVFRPESAMTVMDYEGHIKGIVGGKGQKTTNRGLNRALSSPRQPGSTMKPIGAYALAIETDKITYSSKLEDAPITIQEDGKTKAWPVNWFREYTGYEYTFKALERSFNTIPVRLVKEITPEASYAFMTEKLGVTTLDASQDVNLSSLALGGSHLGLTTTESAAAYAVFGNLGRYYKPTTFVKVTDQHGNVVIERNPEPVIALSEDSACVMNHLLQRVVYGPEGTGGRARPYSSKMRVYAKTGTSDNSNDLWFVGGTPYYVGSCWYGFDEPSAIRNSAAALNIWLAVMKEIHKNLEEKAFPESEFVKTASYCSISGKIAATGCPVGGTGYYKSSYMPVCDSHSGYGTVSSETTSQAQTSAPQSSSTTTTSAASSKPQPSSATSSREPNTTSSE